MGHDAHDSKTAAVRVFPLPVPRRVLFTAVALASVVAGAIAGCAAMDDVAAPPEATVTTPPCPATLAKTNGAACGTEATYCTPSFPCGATNQIAKCTCTKGKFACEDGVGPLLPGAPPRCGGAIAPSGACPATMAAAEGTRCAEPWHECVYKGTDCRGSDRPAADVCYCRKDGDGLAYHCEPAPCSPPLPPREAGAGGG